MALPEEVDIFCGGGRGGGKSYGLALMALRHCVKYGLAAKVLYLRRSYLGLRDFEGVCRELFTMVYGAEARHNQTDHLWRLPGGGTIELGQLESHSCYPKFQGRSFTLLLVDECGQYPSPELLDLMRSNLRGPVDVPVRVVLAANPAGVGHMWLANRYVFNSAGPWKPFYEEKSKRTWVYAPSTYDQNLFIDRAGYLDQLQSSCPNDPELLKAWVDGDWGIVRGAYFASVLDERRNAVPQWKNIPIGWDFWLGHDFGSSAPSVTYVLAMSPGDEHEGIYYPRGSIVLADELATARPDDLNAGLGWTADVTAEAVKTMAGRWDMKAKGTADDAIFNRNGSSAGSIADEFARKGVHFTPAHKADRVGGWQFMRRMLADAGKPDRPGLYVSRGCSYFWNTVPFLARDEKKPEDLDSKGPDHGADAVRYGLLRERRIATVAPLGF